MRRRWLPVAAVLAMVGCAGNPGGERPVAGSSTGGGSVAMAAGTAVERAAMTITPDDMFERIAYLASDELGGRDTPSPGLERAAEYIAGEFRRFGLSPAGDNGTFIQRWQYRATSMDAARTWVQLEAGGGTERAAYGEDFFLLPAAGRESASGKLIYAGSAAAATPPASGAGAFVALFVPGADVNAAWQQNMQQALQAAMSAGQVAGVLLVLDPEFDDAQIGPIARAVAAQQAPMFVIGMRYEKATAMFARAGQDLDALRTTPPAAALDLPNANVSVAAAASADASRPPNVVGILRGSDPALRDQYVVFSAHMDHDGIGRPNEKGDSIFNGADDNASGTATVLEVAQAFASLPERPKRSIIFLTVSGEEKGLLGSAYFAENLPVAKEKIVANINLDMVGRNAPDTVVAIGQDYSSLGPSVQAVASRRPELGLVVAPDLWPEEQLFFRSDHFNFARVGIPAIFFTTGLHEQYHTQEDEVELIDRDKITRIARLVFYFAYDVANATDAPAWTEKGRADMRRMTGGG